MITLAITAYNEISRGNCAWIRTAVAASRLHPIIQEVVVVNDASDDFPALQEALDGFPSVRLFQNEENLGVFANKLESVYRATMPWVQLCDSDNFMDPAFWHRLDSLQPFKEDRWYLPSFARPRFDYRHMAGHYQLKDCAGLLQQVNAQCLLNTGNQLVCREPFLDLFGKYRGRQIDLIQPNYFGTDNPGHPSWGDYWRRVYDAVDSYLFNKLWLFNDGILEVVEGLEYHHRVAEPVQSSWSRAPREKELLSVFYSAELRRAAEAISG